MSHRSDDFEGLPEPLVAELKRLCRADVTPSPAVDQAVLNRARSHLAGRRRLLLLRRVAGMAAAVVLVAAVLVPSLSTDNGIAVAKREVRGDINLDGVVDVRDALALARRVESNTAKPVNDLTGDGAIDRRDVDAVAMMAVHLGERRAATP